MLYTEILKTNFLGLEKLLSGSGQSFYGTGVEFVPSVHVSWLTTFWNSSAKGSDAYFWLLWAPYEHKQTGDEGKKIQERL